MEPREATWAEVTHGVVMRGSDLKHYLVVNEAVDGSGQRWLRVQNQHLSEISVMARPDHEPVTLMESSEVEAIVALGSFGARMLYFEDNKTLPIRAMKWYIDPPQQKGRGALEAVRNHIIDVHGVQIADGFPQKVTTYHEWHAEMHSPELITMLLPHTHERET